MLMITVIVIAVVGAILIYAATRPDTFRIERSTSIHAPPEKIFPFINDFRQWKAWSPWEKVDPEARATYSGADCGVGSVYEWSGNKNIGQGRLEIIESSPPSRLLLKIDFIKPFAGHNHIVFTLESHGDSTKVTQAMYGQNPFMARLMGIFFCMDDMVGKKYEEGLDSLKILSEK